MNTEQKITITTKNKLGDSVSLTATITKINDGQRYEVVDNFATDIKTEKRFIVEDIFGNFWVTPGNTACEALKNRIARSASHVARNITKIDNPEGDYLVSTAEQRCIMQEYNPDCEINVGK